MFCVFVSCDIASADAGWCNDSNRSQNCCDVCLSLNLVVYFVNDIENLPCWMKHYDKT